MENLKAFFTRRPERLLGRCGMLFLMAFFVMNLSSCNDDFIEPKIRNYHPIHD